MANHADLDALAEFERAAVAFKQALDAAEPALDRLGAVKYFGAESLGYWWGEMAHPLNYVIEDLIDIRESAS